MKTPRRQFLVLPQFQMVLLLINFTVLTLIAVVVGFSVKHTFAKLQTVGVQIHLYAGHPYYKLLVAQEHSFYGKLILSLMIALVGSSALIIFLSHRLTGPLIQLRSYFQSIVTRERFPNREIHFRKNDYFPELSVTVNEMMRLVKSGHLQEEDTQSLSNIVNQ